MGRKKKNSASNNNGTQPIAKKPKLETGETFLVKKYRPAKVYAAMEAFVKYTKSHRMLDASYVRWNTGVTPEKPYVFSTRVGGVDLGWGRGKTREAAMDCACRAAFCLVSAHGYNNFPLDEDCLMQAPPPNELPPPPPPPPAGVYPPGLMPPPPPPGAPPLPVIPQPQVASTQAPVASSLAMEDQQVSISLQPPPPPPPPAAVPQRRKLKGGLTLVFDPGEDGEEERCMEENRASLLRYQKLLLVATQR